MKSFLKKHWLIILIFILMIAGTAFSYFSEGFIFKIFNDNPTTTLSFLESFGPFAALIFIGLVILEVVLAPIPPLALYVVAGLLFGGLFGGILTLIGNLIGAFIDFKIARKYGKRRVEKNINRKLKERFDKFFDKYGAFSIFILRVNPLTTSDLVSYLSGLTKIRTFRFILATGIGLIPMIFIQTYLGDILSNSPTLVGLALIFSLVYLILFAYLIIIAFGKKG